MGRNKSSRCIACSANDGDSCLIRRLLLKANVSPFFCCNFGGSFFCFRPWLFSSGSNLNANLLNIFNIVLLNCFNGEKKYVIFICRCTFSRLARTLLTFMFFFFVCILDYITVLLIWKNSVDDTQAKYYFIYDSFYERWNMSYPFPAFKINMKYFFWKFFSECIWFYIYLEDKNTFFEVNTSLGQLSTLFWARFD